MATTGLDISSLLGALGGGAAPDPTLGGAPGFAPPGGAPSTNGGGEEDAIAILKDMIGLAQQYMQVEPDEEDKATMASVLATLQKYLAKDQADSEKLLGGGALSRTLRRV